MAPGVDVGDASGCGSRGLGGKVKFFRLWESSRLSSPELYDISSHTTASKRLASLLSTYMVFSEHLNWVPSDEEIRYIYSFKSHKENSSLIYLESMRGCRIVTEAWNKLSYFNAEWFYVRCPSGFARRWISGHKSNFKRHSCICLIVCMLNISFTIVQMFQQDPATNHIRIPLILLWQCQRG